MRRILLVFLRRYRQRKLVRPWALSAPVLVLLIALPLLRPLRQTEPDLRGLSDDEQARLATVQAIVERHTLAIDHTGLVSTARKVHVGAHWYSDQPPMMAALLSPAYWVLRREGVDFQGNAPGVLYFLTLLGVTAPAACCAGLVYRMGRLFELRRPWRALLAAASVLATGVISYATVLNPHVPAAALLLASAACLVHITIAKKRVATSFWLALAGVCAALSAAIDPSATIFLLLFPAVIVALRWSPGRRFAGVLIYAAGAALPLLGHAALVGASTRDFWQGAALRDPANAAAAHPLRRDSLDAPDAPEEDEEPASPTFFQSLTSALDRIAAGLVGEHGLLSHFPVLVMGVVGGSMIMHRHWPSAAKVLASVTAAGALVVVIGYSIHLKDFRQWRDAMFAARWFIVFGPLLLFWSGAWLRRPHGALAWSLVGLLLAFSVGVSLIGATGPLPREGFQHYTAADALHSLLHPTPQPQSPTALADGS